jgi:hypothetical protein
MPYYISKRTAQRTDSERLCVFSIVRRLHGWSLGGTILKPVVLRPQVGPLYQPRIIVLYLMYRRYRPLFTRRKAHHSLPPIAEIRFMELYLNYSIRLSGPNG